MKLVFGKSKIEISHRIVFNQKIVSKHCVPRLNGKMRDRIKVSKTSRLIEIEFSTSSDIASIGSLEFFESEILVLASLCRRGRSDEDFMRAIDLAGRGIGEIRKILKTGRSAGGSNV